MHEHKRRRKIIKNWLNHINYEYFKTIKWFYKIIIKNFVRIERIGITWYIRWISNCWWRWYKLSKWTTNQYARSNWGRTIRYRELSRKISISTSISIFYWRDTKSNWWMVWIINQISFERAICKINLKTMMASLLGAEQKFNKLYCLIKC